MTGRTRTGSRDRPRSPDSIRAMSMSSLMSASRWRPAPSIRSTPSLSSSLSSDSWRSCAKPRMEFSGVRSSWLVLDKNEFFAWVALMAVSLAAVSSAVRLASSASALRCDSARRPISSPAGITGSSGSPSPSRRAFSAFMATRLAMPEVNRATPASPASSPSTRPAMSSSSILVCSAVSLLCCDGDQGRGTGGEIGDLAAQPVHGGLPVQQRRNEVPAEVPSLMAERSCASSASSWPVVASTACCWRPTPAMTAASAAICARRRSASA